MHKMISTVKSQQTQKTNKLAPYGEYGRLFTTDVSANFKVT